MRILTVPLEPGRGHLKAGTSMKTTQMILALHKSHQGRSVVQNMSSNAISSPVGECIHQVAENYFELFVLWPRPPTCRMKGSEVRAPCHQEQSVAEGRLE